MDGKVFEKINMESYELEPSDYTVAMMLKCYLENLSIDDAREALEKVFPSNMAEDGTMRVSAPELIAFIKDAQSMIEKDTNNWNLDQFDSFLKPAVGIIKSVLPDNLDAKEYVKVVPYGLVDMLHDCYKAIESATGIYRFK